ncbi:MAG: hypothetical protein Q7P63_08795 [Verrucomicrobiota bacterium JB022]|nr:hypothetical protein [Verrucomicrobiota bacterium JB022]
MNRAPLFLLTTLSLLGLTGCETAESKAAKAAEAAATAMGEVWMEPITEAEQQQHRAHYYFAHRALPHAIYNDAELLATELNRQGVEYLRRLWDSMADAAPAYVPAQRNEVQLSIENGADGSTIYFITFPEPQFFPQAYYATFVYPAPAGIHSYYTLEMSRLHRTPESETQYAEIGAWEGPQHLEFGSSEVISEGVFRALIRRVVAGETSLSPQGLSNTGNRHGQR